MPLQGLQNKRLQLFLERDLKGQTLVNYEVKSDIKASRKAEKVNKAEISYGAIRNGQLQTEFTIAKLGIENAQMRYARKLQRLRTAKIMNEHESRARTAGSSLSARTMRSLVSSQGFDNTELRELIRQGSRMGQQATEQSRPKTSIQPTPITPNTGRSKTAGTDKRNKSSLVRFDDGSKEMSKEDPSVSVHQKIFLSKLESLVEPVKNKIVEEIPEKPPTPVVYKSRNPRLSIQTQRPLDGGRYAKEFRRYNTDAPTTPIIDKENKILNSDKDDAMYAWLGYDNQEAFDKARGVDKFRALALKAKATALKPKT